MTDLAENATTVVDMTRVVDEIASTGLSPHHAHQLVTDTVRRMIADLASTSLGNAKALNLHRDTIRRPHHSLLDTVPDPAMAGVVTLGLLQALRSVQNGPQCPDVDLPTLYAAELVHAAYKHATGR